MNTYAESLPKIRVTHPLTSVAEDPATHQTQSKIGSWRVCRVGEPIFSQPVGWPRSLLLSSLKPKPYASTERTSFLTTSFGWLALMSAARTPASTFCSSPPTAPAAHISNPVARTCEPLSRGGPHACHVAAAAGVDGGGARCRTLPRQEAPASAVRAASRGCSSLGLHAEGCTPSGGTATLESPPTVKTPSCVHRTPPRTPPSLKGFLSGVDRCGEGDSGSGELLLTARANVAVQRR